MIKSGILLTEEDAKKVGVTNRKIVAEEIMLVEEDCTKEAYEEISLNKGETVPEVAVVKDGSKEGTEEGELNAVVCEDISLDRDDIENKTATQGVETEYSVTSASKVAVKEVPKDIVHYDKETILVTTAKIKQGSVFLDQSPSKKPFNKK